MTGEEILDLPMAENDSGADTIRGYLKALLHKLWDEDEGFSGKRPFGNSGWYRDLIDTVDESGASVKHKDAFFLIHEAIDAL